MAITRTFISGTMDTSGGTTLTCASFDSSAYTHLAVFTKHEGATTTIDISDNKGSGTFTKLTKQGNSVTDSWGQWHWVKIGTPGTGTTVTMTTGSSPFRTVIVYGINSGTGNIAVESQTTATGTTALADAGTLTTAVATISLMGVAEYNAGVYTVGTGWTEDFDPNGPNYTYAESRSDASGATIDPSATFSTTQDWAACAVSFAELTAAALQESEWYPTEAQPAGITVGVWG